MYQKQCRLTIADKYYGKGGGGGGVPATVVRRNVSKEWPKVRNWSRRWSGQEYPRYRENEPILSPLYSQAQAYMKEGASPVLKEMQGQALEGLQREGALSPEEEGRIRASTLATAGAMGMGNTPGTLGTELLNREQYRQQREGIARQYASGTEQLGQANVAQRFQLPSSVLQTGVSSFGQLTNPILDYLGKAFTPQVVGGTAQPGDTTGGSAISAIGSVIGAALPLIFSDERLKENIRDTGEKTAEGLPIKDFSYLGDKRRFRGVLAQDVEKVKPEAVMRNPLSGHLMLNLERLPGTPFYELKKE